MIMVVEVGLSRPWQNEIMTAMVPKNSYERFYSRITES